MLTLDHQCCNASASERVDRDIKHDEHIVYEVSKEVQVC